MLGLDALRGLAVFLMVEQHMGVWLWRGPPAGPIYPVLIGFNALGGAAAPLFITLAGIGSTLLAHKRVAKGRNPDWTQIRRGLAVMAFGYFLSLITPSWFSWRTWFVLHLMGLGMLGTPVWRRLPTWTLLALGASILALTGPLQVWLDSPLDLHNPYMAGQLEPIPAWAGLRIAIAEGQFPIFPWMAFFFVGLACGRFIVEDRLSRVAIVGSIALATGAAGAGIWALGLTEKPGALWRSLRINIPFFPASASLILGLMGIVLLAIFAVLAWEQRRPLHAGHFMVTLGRASLTLLLLHVWLFRQAVRPIGLWQSQPAGTALLIIIGFLIVAALASKAWQRVDYRFGAEWILRKLAP